MPRLCPIRHFSWLPRSLAIASTSFFLLFSFDSLSPLGFFIHNIPTLCLLGATTIAWKNSTLGGIAFLFIGGAFSLFFGISLETIFIPLLLWGIGALFFLQKKLARHS